MHSLLRTLWLPVCLVFLLLSCKTKPSLNVVPIVFLAPVAITPVRPTIQVGDTVWVEAAFSDSLLDYNSNHRYRVQPQDLGLTCYFAIAALYGTGQPTNGIATTFRVVEKIGKAGVGGSLTGQFFPTYDGHTYRFKFGLISSQPGIASISLLLLPLEGASGLGKSLPSSTPQLLPDPQGREQKAVLEDMFFVVNEGKANNYDLYSKYATVNPNTVSMTPKQLLYVQKSTFTVEVK